jgi:hypothetical protein
MFIDLSRWSPGVITAAATCLAATVAAVTGFVVAAINSWSARKLAREAAQREFRLNAIRPYLEFFDQRIALHYELLEANPGLATSLVKAKTLSSSERDEKAVKEFEAALLRLTELIQKLEKLQSIYHNAGIFALVLADQKVLDSFLLFVKSGSDFMNLIVKWGGFSSAPEDLELLNKRNVEALKAAIKLRIAIESHIFRSRGFLRRGSYFMWSKTVSTLKKWRSPRTKI